MKLSIKNMVCERCKMVVKAELEKLDLHPVDVSLGEIHLLEDHLEEEKERELKERLNSLGFEWIEDKRSIINEQIKTAIIELVHYQKSPLKENISDYLSKRLQQDYAQLSAGFSALEPYTIEHYYILQKIERVKELLAYGELNLSEIAYELNYSSVAHLSSQFKKVTGLTPTKYKLQQNRKTLDRV